MMHRPPWRDGQGVGLQIRRLRVRVPQGVVAHSKQCSEAGVMRKRLNLGADPTSSVRVSKVTASDRLRLFFLVIPQTLILKFFMGRILSNRLFGLVVRFSLCVREVPGSIPGAALPWSSTRS